MAPARDERLLAYAFVGIGGLGGAILGGQPHLVVLAAPFLVALVLGLRRTGPVRVRIRTGVDRDPVVEGDRVTVRLEAAWDGPMDARLLLHRVRGMAVETGSSLSSSVRGAESVQLTARMSAEQWGRHGLGEVWLQLRLPFGLLTWTRKLADGPAVRVLPSPERLDRVLHPRESRAVWGQHPSRRIGDGHEFAELRPYVPGDRLRDLSWTATARLGKPVVRRHHPELAGEIVIAVDAFDDGSTVAAEALSRAARAAWALTSVHLRGNDRVGLVGLGGSTRWFAPAGGRLARYRLLDSLLQIGGDAAQGVAAARHIPHLPGSALRIVLTPLHTPDVLETVGTWRARGRTVVVMVIDGADLLGEPARESERLARRLWRLERERRVQALEALGVPVVVVPPRGPITPGIAALGRARSLRSRRGARA